MAKAKRPFVSLNISGLLRSARLDEGKQSYFIFQDPDGMRTKQSSAGLKINPPVLRQRIIGAANEDARRSLT